MSSSHSPQSVSPAGAAAPEKYLIAFVIQGDDVFKITADNIIHTIGTASGPAFDAIAKLKAAAALLELTNRHKERPDELRQMARELANEGMKLMARASASIRSVPAESAETAETAAGSSETAAAAAGLAESAPRAPRSISLAEERSPAAEGAVASSEAVPAAFQTNPKIALISG